MATIDGYPGISSFIDAHGKERWRYRRKGKTVALPSPDDPAFPAAYQAAIEGRQTRTAKVVMMPGASLPETFGAAWRAVKDSAEWKKLDAATRLKNTRLAEEFLSMPILEGEPETWRDIPVRDLRRKHVKQLLTKFVDRPVKGKHMLTAIRKMTDIALDEEWIEYDPLYKIKWRPETKGWKAWTADAFAAYEKRWPIVTTPRLVYAVALWLGNRRSDVARLRWDQRCMRTVLIDGERREVDGFQIVQKKGGKSLFMPITPMLADCLAATKRVGETVIVTAYGVPFSEKSLTGMMAHWTNMAGMPKGFTLHGLRKSLGVKLAEADATTRQIMEALGHDDIEHAELYSREASQVRLAVQGMDKVVKLERRG